MKVIIFYSSLLFLFTCSGINQDNKTSGITTSSKELVKTNGLLQCATNIVNFGSLTKGEIINQNFDFVNFGSEEVEITAYQASCNCTDLKISEALIAPKDSTKITMIIETHDKSPGEHIVTATIKTNGQRTFYLLTTNFTLID